MEGQGRLGLPPAWWLLALVALVVGVGAAVDLTGRPSGPEPVIRRYFAALERGDVDAALETIMPSAREASTAFVENGIANEYRIVGIAVRHPSLLARMAGEAPGPRDATVFLDITQAVDGMRWQASPRVALVEVVGRWYLGQPPLSEGLGVGG